ncbi:MAG TPA: hypothetical protein VIF62_21175 [Labilithrix sp.]
MRLALLVLGIGGVIATALLYAHDPDRIAVAMCASWWIGLTIAIGALGAVMTLNVSHATWFVVFRPITSSIAAVMPLLALGLVPAVLVAHRVYPWAGAEQGVPPEILERLARTRPWMSPWPVYVRTLVSLGVWSTLAIWLHARAETSRSRVVSGAGLPLLAITATVTPFDWMMRVEPGWTSSIYGLYVAVSGFYGATGLIAIASYAALRDAKPDHFHAHGRLMLTAVCLWGYLGFFQLMLQWIGDKPAEAGFWVRRGTGDWATVATLLVVFHFVVPFFLLLSRPLKRSAGGLAAVGTLMVVMHLLDVGWLVIPSRSPSLYASVIAPLCAVIGLGGAWIGWRFSRLSPIAIRDPDYPEGARYESP